MALLVLILWFIVIWFIAICTLLDEKLYHRHQLSTYLVVDNSYVVYGSRDRYDYSKGCAQEAKSSSHSNFLTVYIYAFGKLILCYRISLRVCKMVKER